jgi:zinc/manganese transport system permease protein
VLALAIVAVLAIGLLGLAGRPLLFASLDEAAARSRGVPARALGVCFLLLLGLAVAETAQITGALLVFALLVAPPATAQLLTARVGASLALSVVFGLLVTWLGLALAYFYGYPVGFHITTIAFAIYVVVRLSRSLAERSVSLRAVADVVEAQG